MIGTVQIVIDKPPESEPIASASSSMDMHHTDNIGNDNINNYTTPTTYTTTSTDFNHNNESRTHNNNYSFLNTFSSDTGVVKPAYVR